MKVFERANRLPAYVFSLTNDFKQEAAAKGAKVIDFSMGNPDGATPAAIVECLREQALLTSNHRYSCSGGIDPLRQALSRWYKRHYDVSIDPKTETVVTLGSKEGLAHLMLAIANQEDVALVPTPCYPIHYYGFVIAGSEVKHIPLDGEDNSFPEGFYERVKAQLEQPCEGNQYIVLNFPANPTGHCVDLAFFEKIVALAKQHDAYIIHDLAYGELGFDGYQPPSILQVPGAKDVAVESYSLSKSYNMPGWRVGFISGNQKMVAALRHIKTYLDYGMFAPIEYAAAQALEQGEKYIQPVRQCYQQRRDLLCRALNNIGWHVTPPRATMFLWAKIPKPYRHLGSIEFTRHLINNSSVAVSPGVGFGLDGDQFVRFAFIEDEAAIEQASKNIAAMFEKDSVSVEDLVD